jgi:hypothetical protein
MRPSELIPERARLLAGGVVGLVAALALTGTAGCARLAGRAPTGLFLVEAPGARPGAGLATAPAVDASQIDRRLADAAATTGGELEISLAWNGLTDLDLQVQDPFGKRITAHDRYSASGGVQDVDANPTLVTEAGHQRAEAGLPPGPENVLPLPEALVDLEQQLAGSEELARLLRLSGGGSGLPGEGGGLLGSPGHGKKAPSRFTRRPVEHIFFARAPKGTYTVLAQCYSWREPAAAPLPFTVQVRTHGRVFHQATAALGPANYCANGLAPMRLCQFVVR